MKFSWAERASAFARTEHRLGGKVVHRGVRGKVLPGGTDWQLTRPDGVTQIKAIYAIETDDGAVIAVHNRGLVAPPAGGEGRPFVRSRPRFQAPEGAYEWLNRRIFTGTITPSPQADFVTIRVFPAL